MLKHIIYVYYGCMNRSEVGIGLNCDVMMSFHSSSDPDIANLERLPLWLPPEPHDELTRTFKALKLTCQEAKPTKW